MELLPNERFSDIYYYFLPIKLSVCPEGGILGNKSNGFDKLNIFPIFFFIKKRYTCVMCEANKYSLSMYGKCEECPTGGKCVNGILIPQPGKLIFKKTIFFQKLFNNKQSSN